MLTSEQPHAVPQNQPDPRRPVFYHPARSRPRPPPTCPSLLPPSQRLPTCRPPAVTGGSTLPPPSPPHPPRLHARPPPRCTHLFGTGFFLFLPAYIPPAAPSTGSAEHRARGWGGGGGGGRARRRGLRGTAAGRPRSLPRPGPRPPRGPRTGPRRCTGPARSPVPGSPCPGATVGRERPARRVTVRREPANPGKHRAHGPPSPWATVPREPLNPRKRRSPGSHQILGNAMPMGNPAQGAAVPMGHHSQRVTVPGEPLHPKSHHAYSSPCLWAAVPVSHRAQGATKSWEPLCLWATSFSCNR